MTDADTPPLVNADHATNVCTDTDRNREFYGETPESEFVEPPEGR
ncbi:hypothetical protein [Halorussus sp. MSC15.2]|nr:hypothetical protein [Halorussus sp. MSC15.2]